MGKHGEKVDLILRVDLVSRALFRFIEVATKFMAESHALCDEFLREILHKR